jgi:hypothetical protein
MAPCIRHQDAECAQVRHDYTHGKSFHSGATVILGKHPPSASRPARHLFSRTYHSSSPAAMLLHYRVALQSHLEVLDRRQDGRIRSQAAFAEQLARLVDVAPTTTTLGFLPQPSSAWNSSYAEWVDRLD